MDTENKKILLLTSLRQMIGTPATPTIETIQSVVSSMRTITPTQSLKIENEARLTDTMVVNAKEEINEHGTQTLSTKQIEPVSEILISTKDAKVVQIYHHESTYL